MFSLSERENSPTLDKGIIFSYTVINLIGVDMLKRYFYLRSLGVRPSAAWESAMHNVHVRIGNMVV